jgi:hypothetical protein
MRHEASCANKEPAMSKPPSVTKPSHSEDISLSKLTSTTLSTNSRRSEADSTAKIPPSTKTGQQPLSIIPEDEGEQNIPNDVDRYGYGDLFIDGNSQDIEYVDEDDDDKDDERSSGDDRNAEPPSSPVRPPKARGKGKAMEKGAIPASKCYYFFCYFGLLTQILFIVKFMIPFRNQVGVIAHRTHSVELTTTLDAVKTTIHWIIGLYAIPEEKRTGLVTHFYKDPARRCFALETEEDWTALKAEWVNQVAKRGVDACIDIVLPPKVRFHFITIYLN